MWLEREVDCPGVTEDRKLQAHGPFLPSQDSQGACSSCDSCSGTPSLTLGPAPPGLPAGSLPVAWRAGGPLGGCGLVAGRRVMLRGEGVAPEQWVPALLPSIASCSVRGPGCAIVAVGERPPTPVCAVD